MSKKIFLSVGRYGDYSLRAYVVAKKIIESTDGILVSVVPDDLLIDTAPNPRFCNFTSGGKSMWTYQELVKMFRKSKAPGSSTVTFEASLLPGDEQKKEIRLTYDGSDIVVGCHLKNGEACESEVIFLPDNPHHQSFLLFFQAMRNDSQREKTHQVFLI